MSRSSGRPPGPVPVQGQDGPGRLHQDIGGVQVRGQQAPGAQGLQQGAQLGRHLGPVPGPGPGSRLRRQRVRNTPSQPQSRRRQAQPRGSTVGSPAAHRARCTWNSRWNRPGPRRSRRSRGAPGRRARYGRSTTSPARSTPPRPKAWPSPAPGRSEICPTDWRNFGGNAAIGKFLAVSATMAHRSYRLPVVDLEDFIDVF